MKTLKITPIQTEIFRRGQSLSEFIIKSLSSYSIAEGSIICITSKIVSLSENRLISKSEVLDKDELICKEADYDLGKVAFDCRLTIKEGLFIPSAGIDESNSEEGDYILYPEDPFLSAKNLYLNLTKSYQLNQLGVLLSDSHTLPLRQGVTGIALSYWGFHGVRNMVGTQDLFGRELKMTQMDLADGLSSAAVLMMGEANESCPLAVIENAPVDFVSEVNPNEILISPEKDLYYPLYKDRIIKGKNSQ